jgi:hypothetical protein
MRLSEFLRKNIIETKVGEVANKFKFHKRRDTLFFEELLARYVIECENKGFGMHIMEISRRWMLLYFTVLVPSPIKRMPKFFLLNSVMRKIWNNMGLIEDYHMEKDGDVVRIKTVNEAITRTVGANKLTVGFHMGIMEALFGLKANVLIIKQDKEHCEYEFRLEGTPLPAAARTKECYKTLNTMQPVRGYTLTDALKRKMIVMKDDNRMYFRSSPISPVENTLFHMIGELNIMPESMPRISYDFFRGVVRKDANKESKLSLLKTLFQVMGWGMVTILVKSDGGIIIEIRNPPHGLAEQDNWTYLFRTFLGYLWLVDRRLRLASIRERPSSVTAEYSR